MSSNLQFSFSLYDVFSVIGLFQAMAVIVYILFRAGRLAYVVVPVLCFLVLAGGFILDFGDMRIGEHFPLYPVLQNGVWLAFPAFSVLLIAQIADLGGFPRPVYWFALLAPAVAVLGGWVAGSFLGGDSEVCAVWSVCQLGVRMDAIFILGVISGLLGFLVLWLGRGAFEGLRHDESARGERYWLIVSFVIINLLFISVMLLHVSGYVDVSTNLLLRNILGVGAVYLASTSLFRIYPPSIQLERKYDSQDLSDEDKRMLDKLKVLLDMDKVYQEPNFSRMDLSRELNASEARVSRIVNYGFGKSLPQVINEHRVRDSLQLLAQTDVQISMVAEQVGFSSVSTFNRVFKEVMGVTPSAYRLENSSASSQIS